MVYIDAIEFLAATDSDSQLHLIELREVRKVCDIELLELFGLTTK